MKMRHRIVLSGQSMYWYLLIIHIPSWDMDDHFLRSSHSNRFSYGLSMCRSYHSARPIRVLHLDGCV